MKRIIFFILIMWLAGSIPGISSNKPVGFWNKNSDPQKISQMVINDLLSRDELMMYHTESLNTVHYAEVCAGMGAIQLARLFNDTALLIKLETRYQGVLNHFDTLPANHVDANVIGVDLSARRPQRPTYRGPKKRHSDDDGMEVGHG